jgi:hypothetical protein
MDEHPQWMVGAWHYFNPIIQASNSSLIVLDSTKVLTMIL